MPVFRFLSLFLVFLGMEPCLASGTGSSVWRAYPPLNDIRAFAIDGGHLWWATTGGAVKWDTAADTCATFTANETGLNERFVSAAAGRDGVIWFVCMSGRIVSYDGSSWMVRRELEDMGISVRSIASGPGEVWFAADSGAVRLRNDIWTRFGSAEGFTNAQVNAIAADGRGTVWFGTTSGLYRFDGSSWTHFPAKTDGPLSNSIQSLAFDETGTLHIGTSSGLSSFDGEKWTSFPLGDGTASSTIASITPAPGGVLWLGTRGGLIRFAKGDTTRCTPENSGLPDRIIRAAAVDARGTLWVATGDTHTPSTPKNGAARYDGSSWRSVRAPSIGGESVYGMATGRDGSLWFVTANDPGVSRYDGSTWRTWSSNDCPALGSVRAIVPDAKGNMWFGAAVGAVKFDGVSWSTHTTADGLPSNAIYSAALDSSGALWFGTAEGPCSFDGREWRTYPGVMDGCASGAVISITVDGRNVKWFGTPMDGLLSFDGDAWRHYTKKEGLTGNRVNALAGDRDNVIWAGTGAWTVMDECGACSFDGMQWTAFRSFADYPHTIVTGIDTDPLGHTWMVSEYASSVFMQDSGKWIRYDSPWSDGFRCIAIDGRGTVWLGGKESGVASLVPGDDTTPSGIRSPSTAPRGIHISGIGPNPFNALVSITFDVSGARTVTAAIYDITGRRVRILHRGMIGSGPHRLVWNGADDNGRAVSSGVYFARIAGEPHEAIGRMLFLK